MKFIKKVLSKIGGHVNEALREELRQARQDNESLHLLPELGLDYVPWTEASLRPAGVRALLNEIVIHGRRSILEFGSGISTLYLASHFEKKESGQVVTVEEDKDWAEVVEGYLDELEVSESRYRILRAPLKPFGETDNPSVWYDTEVLRRELQKETFDMLLVDGPVSWKEENAFARYPALPVVADWIKKESVIFLDDAEWGDQREILSRWADDHDLETEIIAGMGVLRPQSSSAPYDII
jgi:predicted O-methyltransferase YrrM